MNNKQKVAQKLDRVADVLFALQPEEYKEASQKAKEVCTKIANSYNVDFQHVVLGLFILEGGISHSVASAALEQAIRSRVLNATDCVECQPELLADALRAIVLHQLT